MSNITAYYHLPGLFEFYELYKVFLPTFYENREYFYDWCEIGSIYGAPNDCIWSGGRIENSNVTLEKVIELLDEYNISPRLTFSNSLVREEHFNDKRCNEICSFLSNHNIKSGIIIYSDELLNYIRDKYHSFYFISSTTKVITNKNELINELDNDEYSYVVPDFRMNNKIEFLKSLSKAHKDKLEMLCNECCWFECYDRKNCYESVSRIALGEESEHRCCAPNGSEGYIFSNAMKNPGFIGIQDIQNTYLPIGISNFKIEGRSLGSAMILEFLLYYMTKPEYQLNVREKIYLNHSLDIF